MSKSVKLSIFLNGELKGVKIVPLPCIIGRGRESGVVISHPLVSRKHCMLSLEDGKLRLRDVGSLNGIIYRDNRVIETVLAENDVFSIGNISFMVKLMPGTVDTPVPYIEPKNNNGVYEGIPKSPKPVKLPPFPLPSSIPPNSSTQFIPLPPSSIQAAAEGRISPQELSDVVDLAAPSQSPHLQPSRPQFSRSQSSRPFVETPSSAGNDDDDDDLIIAELND